VAGSTFDCAKIADSTFDYTKVAGSAFVFTKVVDSKVPSETSPPRGCSTVDRRSLLEATPVDLAADACKKPDPGVYKHV
jgi:hypothetical protein